MTETEWLACGDTWDMVQALGDHASDRKLRLYACGCCRRLWHLLSDERSRRAVEIAEQYADEPCSPEEQKQYADGPLSVEERIQALLAADTVEPYTDGPTSPEQRTRVHCAAGQVLMSARRKRDSSEDDADHFAYVAVHAAHSTLDPTGMEAAKRMRWDYLTKGMQPPIQVELLRDVFADRFLPVTFSPSWRSETAVSLARMMYETRAFHVMHILADALEEAGCDDAHMLAHCRSPGLHVRGCWVVDLVLGKG